MTEPDDLVRRLAVARGDEPADLVLRGGRVLCVFTGELLEADVAVVGQHIAGLGDYEGSTTVDVGDSVLVPGFIDGHMHLESTKLTPAAFASAVLPWGTTTAVLDPHEIANVFGSRGVHALFVAADRLPIDLCLMVSSCVPAGPFESSGATLDSADVAALLSDEPRAIGVAELMDFPGVVAGDPGPLGKVRAAQRAGRHVDGHAPGLTGKLLNAYVAAGISSDHECTTAEEALEKRRLGMWIMLREGSAAHNLAALLPVIREFGPANCLLCTDDREPDDLLSEGHVNAVVRKAVALGCSAADAVTMATLNAARYHRLYDRGGVAPGYLADILVLPDLTSFRPSRVYKRGQLVAEDGRAIEIPVVPLPDWMRGSVHIPDVSAADFRLPAPRDGGRVRVIDVRAGQVATGSQVVSPTVVDGEIVADVTRDLAKIAVIERHHGTGRMGRALVSGFGLSRGAFASTIAHDAHNIVVVGVSDEDMAVAVRRLGDIGGGQIAVADGRVLDEVACPIGGLLSDRPAAEVATAVRRLGQRAAELGCRLPAPFMTMSFLALSVIPDLKLTDQGLVDVMHHRLVPFEVAAG